MIELLLKFVVLVVATAIGIGVWRSRTDELMRIRQARNYALAAMLCVVASHLIDVVSILALMNSLISPETRRATDVMAAAVSATGIMCALVAVWRWLQAGKRLASIAGYEVARSEELHTRLIDRGRALSTVPAIISRASNLDSDPELMRLEFMNDKVEEILGYSGSDRITMPREFLSLMHPDDYRKYVESEYATMLEQNDSILEHRYRHRDGSYRWIRRHIQRVNDEDGNLKELIACGFDITDLKDAEARLKSFLDFAPDAVVTVDESLNIVMASDRAVHSFKFSDVGLLGENVEVLFAEESRHASIRLIADEFSGQKEDSDPASVEIVCKHGDGSSFPAEMKLSTIEDGNHRLVAVAVRDISDRKEAEAKLQQAQKMEVVGQLTGGIAHDFNNMLTVIAGNLQLIDTTRLALEDRDHAQAAMEAVDRAAELTSRLLAFSRHRLLQPQVLNANDLIRDIESLLRRSIGESIVLRTNLADDLWHTKVDRSQLENALVNLSVNARDALRDGGSIEIASSNVIVNEGRGLNQPKVPPGEYVRLVVRDDGDGIEQSNLSRIFEPFFTTKKAGKGSGLGLSMVHAFVTESRGHVTVASEDGAGTTFMIYLPRSTGSTSTGDVEALPASAIPKGNERILVVEDNDPVRKVVAAILTSLNYQVIEARSGQDALEVMENGEEFDLLFTDQVMPGGISGTALAASMRRSRPGLKVLYTSGNSTTLKNENRAAADGRFLQKPYVKETLARMVREALDC